jgi:hypothetical protein
MDAGEGILTLSSEGFHLLGTIHDTEVDLNIPTCAIPALPFSPGKHLEIQDGSAIYRCLPEDGRLVMKFINMIKINYALRSENPEKSAEKLNSGNFSSSRFSDSEYVGLKGIIKDIIPTAKKTAKNTLTVQIFAILILLRRFKSSTSSNSLETISFSSIIISSKT